jgi:hypothetical protein
MSTPLPGQIRCPTCHRSTPPAGFCTQCGTAIPASARARPRGLDRAELQDRIRVHRPGDAAFRRGSTVGEGYAQASSYQPYRPEPEDELIVPAADAGDEAALHVDNTPPGFDDRPPPPPPVVTPPPAMEPPPVVKAGPIFTPPPVASPVTPPLVAAAPEPPPVVAAEPPAPQWAAPQDPYDSSEAYDYRYRPPNDDWGERGSGMSPLAIGGFVLLGVLAIAVGAFISGIFSGGVAQATPSPTPLVTAVPSASVNPTPQPTSVASAPVSPSPSSGSPGPFPDGFTARTEPCADQPTSQDGCNASGASVSGGSIWVWIGWRKGTPDDVLGVTILNASGNTVGNGSLALSSLCDKVCSGWGRFRFGGLTPGNYTIRLDRNGQPAADSSFTVTG